MPARHLWHSLAPLALHVPAEHETQVPELLKGWYFPAEHRVQLADLVDEKVPTGHAVHVIAPVVPLELFPASHGWQ